jgi:hypothetical protein
MPSPALHLTRGSLWLRLTTRPRMPRSRWPEDSRAERSWANASEVRKDSVFGGRRQIESARSVVGRLGRCFSVASGFDE